MSSGTFKRRVLFLAVPLSVVLLLFALSPCPRAEEPSGSEQSVAARGDERGDQPEEKHPLDDPFINRSPSSRGYSLSHSLPHSLTGLFFVLGILFLSLYLVKKWGSARKPLCPETLFQTIACFPISGRVQGRVVRFGPKILLLAVSRDRVVTLSELNETPSELGEARAAAGAATVSPSKEKTEEGKAPKEAAR